MLLVLYTTGIIPNELRESLKLLNLRPALCNVMQQALILSVPVNKKCLVSETRTALRTSETAVKEGKWVVVVVVVMMMMICFGKWQCKSTKRLSRRILSCAS
jgi:hypothetical protein